MSSLRLASVSHFLKMKFRVMQKIFPPDGVTTLIDAESSRLMMIGVYV